MLALALNRWIEKKRRKDSVCNLFRIEPAAAGPAGANDVALVLICRNAGAYIDEWLRFHELAGVRHFYIYDNGSKDDTAVRARRHAGEAEVVLHPWIARPYAQGDRRVRLSAQELAYSHAALNYGRLHRWMAFIDIDEFVFPVKHDTLPEALAGLAQRSCISLPWCNFGHCGHETMPPDPVLYSYRQRHQPAASEAVDCKCIVQPAKLATVGIHEFEMTDMGWATVNDRGEVLAKGHDMPVARITNDLIQLNHYRTKSIAEHRISKRYYMHGQDETERDRFFLFGIEKLAQNTCEDTAAIDFLRRRGIASAAQFQACIDRAS